MHEYVTYTFVTRNGLESKLTLHVPQSTSNYILGPERKRDCFSEEKQTIPEKLKNMTQLIPLLFVHHLNLSHPTDA